MLCRRRLFFDLHPVTALTLVMALSACGDDDAGAGTDAGSDAAEDGALETGPDGGVPDAKVYDPISLEMFCEAWKTAAAEIVCVEVSEEECESTLGEGSMRCLTVKESISAGRTNYDGAEAARCLAETQPSDLANGWNFGFIPDCAAFSGGVGEGGDCYPDATIGNDECATGYCDWAVDSCPGKCTPFQARGATCNAQLRCGGEDYCQRDCQPPCDGTCEERPGEGEPCEIYCRSGFLCSPTQGTCIRVKPEGSTCTLDEECEQGFCRDDVCQKVANAKGDPCRSNDYCPEGLVCDFLEGNTCQDPVPLGEECPAGNDVCVDGAVCATPIEEGTPTCEASLGKDGDPCTYLCEEDYFCSTEGDTQVCRADLGQGEDCSSQTAISGILNLACQEGLWCMESSTNTCLPPGKIDEPCFYNRNETCEAGLWCTIIGSKCVEPATGDELCYSNWPDTCLPTHYCGTADGKRAGWGTDTCHEKLDLEKPCLEDSFCKSDICLRATEEDVLGTCASERPQEGPDRCVPAI